MTQFGESLIDTCMKRGEPAMAQRFLIVDTSATNPDDIAFVLKTQPVAIDLLSGQPVDWCECVSPALLALPDQSLHGQQARSWRAFFDKWRYANCFLYVETTLSQADLAEALARRTKAVLEGGLPVLLRFFDPRIFATLVDALHPKQRQLFLSVGSRWSFPDRWGVVHHIDSAQDTKDVADGPLMLDNAQQAALIDAGEADAVINILLNQQHPALTNLLPPEQHKRVSAALAAARRWAISQVSDQVAFSALWLELGEGFDATPPWCDQLQQVQAGRKTWNDVLDQVALEEHAA